MYWFSIVSSEKVWTMWGFANVYIARLLFVMRTTGLESTKIILLCLRNFHKRNWKGGFGSLLVRTGAILSYTVHSNFMLWPNIRTLMTKIISIVLHVFVQHKSTENNLKSECTVFAIAAFCNDVEIPILLSRS